MRSAIARDELPVLDVVSLCADTAPAVEDAGGAHESGVPMFQAVVYDSHRDATGHEMADFQQPVMAPPTAMRDAASPPLPGAR